MYRIILRNYEHGDENKPYKVTSVNDITIHSDFSPNQKVKVLDPVLTLTANTAGSFEFTINPDNSGYDSINMLKSDIIIYAGNSYDKLEEIWRGRPLTESTDFYNRKKIYVEGALAFLVDTLQEYWYYNKGDMTLESLVQTILDNHNKQVYEERRITIGEINVYELKDQNEEESKKEAESTYANFTNTMDLMTNKILNLYEGYVVLKPVSGTNHLSFNYYPGDVEDDNDEETFYDEVNTQWIEFGKNLLNYVKNYDTTSIVTEITPLGAKLNTTEEIEDHDVNIEVYDDYILTVNSGTTKEEIETNETEIDKQLDSISVITEDGKEIAKKARKKYHKDTTKKIKLKDIDGYDEYVKGKDYSGTEWAEYVKRRTKVIPNMVVDSYYGKLGYKYEDMLINDGEEVVERRLTVYDATTDTKKYPNKTITLTIPDAVEKYGHIRATVEWSDIRDSSELLKKAEKYIKNLKFKNLTISLSVLDLSQLNSNIERLDMFDVVYVKSIPHGINDHFRVYSMTLNLNNPDQSTYTLGRNSTESWSSTSSKLDDKLKEESEKKGNDSPVLVKAKRTAVSLLTDSEKIRKGYMTYISDPDTGRNVGIQIANASTDEAASRKWVFNVNGLGHLIKKKNKWEKSKSKNTKTETYTDIDGKKKTIKAEYPEDWDKSTTNCALTMDGKIVADYITAGIMSGDRIKGGTIIVGGKSYSANGKISVLNSESKEIVRIDKTGITMAADTYLRWKKDPGYLKTDKNGKIPWDIVKNAPKILKEEDITTISQNWIRTYEVVAKRFSNKLSKEYDKKDWYGTSSKKQGKGRYEIFPTAYFNTKFETEGLSEKIPKDKRRDFNQFLYIQTKNYTTRIDYAGRLYSTRLIAGKDDSFGDKFLRITEGGFFICQGQQAFQIDLYKLANYFNENHAENKIVTYYDSEKLRTVFGIEV